MTTPIFASVLKEINQDHSVRKPLFDKLEDMLGRPVVTYFGSFRQPVILDDSDVDALEGLLQTMDLSNGLAFIISSPGGSGEAAERMINVCRSYSKTGEFWSIVPGKAKSAATMVCLGSSKIFMGVASELGPVDPQITRWVDGHPQYIAAFHVVNTYQELFEKARIEKGRIEPYLQQLGKYDASEITSFISSIELAEDISLKALESGMMQGVDKDKISKKIQILLTPENTKTHGRPIFRDAAKEVGLVVEELNPQDGTWNAIYELYVRSTLMIDNHFSKLIENKQDQAFVQNMETNRG